MATTTPNFGWDIPQSTDLVKDGATAIAALGTDIDTSLVDLKGGTTGQVLSKNSNTDMDFTWVAQDDSNAIQNAIVDAKGDLISATAADTPARLAVGTNGQVLTADSTQSTGLAWTTISSGGITLIQEIVPNNTASSYSFSSIPGTYKQLLLIWNGTTTGNATTNFTLRINSDSGANYIVNGSDNFGTIQNASNTSIQIGGYTPFYNTDNTGSESSKGRLFIDNYASTTRTKYFDTFYSYRDAAARQTAAMFSGYWNSTSAITSIDIARTTGTGNLSNTTNGSIRLYGLS